MRSLTKSFAWDRKAPSCDGDFPARLNEQSCTAHRPASPLSVQLLSKEIGRANPYDCDLVYYSIAPPVR